MQQARVFHADHFNRLPSARVNVEVSDMCVSSRRAIVSQRGTEVAAAKVRSSHPHIFSCIIRHQLVGSLSPWSRSRVIVLGPGTPDMGSFLLLAYN